MSFSSWEGSSCTRSRWGSLKFIKVRNSPSLGCHALLQLLYPPPPNCPAEKILGFGDMQEILEFVLNIPKDTLFPEQLFKAIKSLKVKSKDLEKIIQDLSTTSSK